MARARYWLRAGVYTVMNFGFHKIRRLYGFDNQLLASQEGFCCGKYHNVGV